MNGIGLIMGCYNRNNFFRGSSVGTLFVYLPRIVHSLLAFQEKFETCIICILLKYGFRMWVIWDVDLSRLGVLVLILLTVWLSQ